jgi:iron complex outermembrane receptor protein
MPSTTSNASIRTKTVRALQAASLSAFSITGMSVGMDTAIAQQATGARPAAATAAPDDSGALDEVVVTAERHSETEQKAPISLQVVAGDALQTEGVSQPQDLDKLVPGLKMTNGANGASSIYIRGVGENSTNQNTQSAVAFNVDGNYIGRTSGVSGNFYDLSRVEVLKGPQGTLYGRNASGGAINLITNKPTDDFGGYIIVEAGDYNLRRTQGAVNLPVDDSLAFRLAFYDSKRDGYLTDGTNDEDQRAARLHALWRPNGDLSVLATIDTSHIGGLGSGTTVFGGGLVGLAISPQGAEARAHNGNAGILGAPSIDIQNWSGNLQIDYDLGWATLTFQPGYRSQSIDTVSAGPNGGVATPASSDQFTGEMRLSHQGDKFKYTAGLYDFHEDVSYTYHIFQFQGGSLLDSYQDIPELDTRSKAAFTEVSYSFIDSLRVIGGLRYTDENRSVDMYTNWYGAGFTPMRLPGIGTYGYDPNQANIAGLTGHYQYNNQADETFINFSYKGGVEYDILPESMLYATVATGFKSGGFSISPPPTNEFQPEKLTAYTLGLKNRFFEDKLQVNLEAFLWNYRNQQISTVTYDFNGAPGFITFNAGKSKIQGFDIDTDWRLTKADTISLHMEYLWAYLQQYDIYQAFPDATGCSFAPSIVLGRKVLLKNCNGFRLPYTPSFAGTLNYAHVFTFEKGTVTPAFHAQFATSQYLQVDRESSNQAAGYVEPDVDVTYRTTDEKWFVTAYCRNISDKLIYNAINSTTNPPTADIQAPRTYGIQLGAKF